MSITNIPSLALPDDLATDAPARAARRARSSFVWLNRPRRILLGLAALWTINVFDLGFTLVEANRVNFIEMNPVAAQFIKGPAYALVAYKTFLVVTGSTILLLFRRERIAEISCWLMLATYTYVAVRWLMYYNHLLNTLNDPTMHPIPLMGPFPA